MIWLGCRVLLVGMVLLNTYNYGICSLTLLLMIILMPIRFEPSGNFSTRAAYRAFSLVQPLLSLENGFGKPGHRGSAKPSFGLLSAIVAGQLTVYKREDFHIQSIAPSVTRMMKRFRIYLLHVFLLDNSGLAFYSHWTWHHWFQIEDVLLWRSGGKNRGGKYPSNTERVSTP